MEVHALQEAHGAGAVFEIVAGGRDAGGDREAGVWSEFYHGDGTILYDAIYANW